MAEHNCLVVRLDKQKTRELVLAPVYVIKGVHSTLMQHADMQHG
jgi:hypothetical protein